MKKIFSFLFLVAFLSSCSAIVCKSAIVTDAKTAISIAQAILLPVLGDDLDAYLPLNATLVNNKIWRVEPAAKLEFGGAVPLVEIKKKNGKILKIIYKPR